MQSTLASSSHMIKRTTEELLEIYDEGFDENLKDVLAQLGDAHKAAVRAVYERGIKDAREPNRPRPPGISGS